MIINDFVNKIKKNMVIDSFTIMCLLVIIGVGIASFGLGRISALHDSQIFDSEVKIVDMKDQESSVAKIGSETFVDSNNPDTTKEKRYVASKSGKLYYSLGCSGVKRIAEKNMIWFNTKEEAEKSGFEFSSSCK